MSDDGRILAYASPTSAIALDAAAGDCSVTFAPPPRGLEIAVNAVGAFLAIAASGASAWFAVKLGRALNSYAPGVLLVLAVALGLVASRRFAAVARLVKFGRLPVTLAVTNGMLHLSDPPQWGLA